MVPNVETKSLLPQHQHKVSKGEEAYSLTASTCELSMLLPDIDSSKASKADRAFTRACSLRSILLGESCQIPRFPESGSRK